MKLLLDENLSYRLLRPLTRIFPGSVHVEQVGLAAADDAEIWHFARENGFTILSNDSDFHQRSFLYGHPPKVIWVRLGNRSTPQLATYLEGQAQFLREFEADNDAALLVLP